MTDLRDLYQEVIIDHGRKPRNFRPLKDASYTAEGFNPLCGDRLTLYVKADANGVIDEVTFQGQGCAISMASASLMSEALKGRTLEQAEVLFESFHNMITDAPYGATIDLGKLKVLAGVKDYPTRIKCATLAWHTLHAALEQDAQPVSTE